MLGLLTTVIGGPLFGVVGSIVTNVLGAITEARRQASEYAHIEKMTELNAKFKAEEMEHDRAKTELVTDAKMLAASYRHDASYGAVAPWAATALRFVRPLLTFLLIGMVIWFFAAGDVGREMIVSKTLFLAEMALTWWFVDRRVKGR
jgi:hypothetical protein